MKSKKPFIVCVILFLLITDFNNIKPINILNFIAIVVTTINMIAEYRKNKYK